MRASKLNTRGGRIGLAAAGFVLTTLAAMAAPVPTLSEPRLIPSNAWMVLSVPDLPAAWKAFVATPIYQDAVALLDSPAVASWPVYRQFLDEKRRMETEVAFPINATSLAAMIAGFDFICLPPSDRNSPPLTVCTFHAADSPRFARLVEYIEGQMSAPRGPRAGVATRPDIAKEQYKNVEIISNTANSTFAMAQLGPEFWAMANHPNAIRALIDQSQRSDGLTVHPRFRTAIAGLGEPQPHGFLYLNSGQSGPSFPGGGLPGLPFSSLVRNLRSEVVMAAGFRIETDAIRFESFLPFADAARDRLAAIYQQYSPATLHSLDYVSSSPLVFMARNTLDGPTLYESVRAMVLASIRAVVERDESAERRLQFREENLREVLGFGLKEDLAPAIGPEAFVSLERVSFDPLLPLPTLDLAAGIQVRDQQRMAKVVTGFEDFFERQLSGLRRTTDTSTVFQSADYHGKTIKWFAVPRAPQYSVGYVRTDSFILMALGGDSLRRALDRADGRRKSFAAGPLYARLQPFLDKQANELLVLNVSDLVGVGREFVRRLSKNAPDQAGDAQRVETILTRIGRIVAFGASTAGNELGLHMRGAIVFRSAETKPKAPVGKKP
jgi:hypothetical protein